MANLPANPGQALWIGGAAGQNHANIGIGQGTSNGAGDHTDYSQALIEEGASPPVDSTRFYLNADGNPVFRINASAGTTSSGTKHPRTECRELQQNGTSNAAWDGRSGDHYLKARCRIITVTSNRPWICFGQIHGSSTSPNTSDLIRLQTEGTNGTSTNLSLIARRTPPGGSEIRTVLRTGYNVGTWFDYELRLTAGTITVKIDGVTLLTASGMGQIDCYFKYGCYLQDSVGEGASSSDWGAVEFQRGSVQVWNTGYPTPTTPVFTGSTDPSGGAGGGAGNDTQAPTVPTNLAAVRGNTQAALSWTASTDNVAVDHYNIYRFSASGAGGGTGSATTLGNGVAGTGGAETTLSSADKMVASSATATASGTLTSGHFRAWLDAAGSTLSKMVVYADSSGVPGAKLATSDELTITATAESVRDYTFSGANQIAITSGTTYWVGAAWDDPGTPSLTFSRDAQSSKRVESTATYGTPPDPWGTVSGTFAGPVDAWVDVVAGTGAGTGGGGTTTTLGKTTNGTSSSASSADKTAVSSATATASGTLNAGHARVWLSAAGAATTKMVVYANSSGAPGARLASSDPVVVTATAEALVDYTFSGADRVGLSTGTTYWVGVAWVDPDPSGATVSLTISRDATTAGRQESSAYAPATFGTPTAQTGPIDAYVDIVSGTGGSAGGAFTLLATTALTTYTNTGLTNGTEYTYAVSAEDAAGNESARSDSAAVTPGPPDTTPPSVPTGVAATAGDGRATITWDASTDADAGMLRYTVYQDGAAVGTVPSNATTARTLVLVGLSNGTLYSFTVTATDRSLNESSQSSAATVTPTAPAIGGAAFLPGRLTNGKVEAAIAWGADLAADESTWAWSDITADVRQNPGISTTLGRNDESSTSNPATLTLVLGNTSGDYSLGAGSANYPYVRRNTPVRLRIDPGSGGGRVVLLAFADGFTPHWEAPGIPVVTLSASGTLRRLSQGKAPVQSVYRRVMTALSSVKAYWPLEEGKDSSIGRAVRGATDMLTTVGDVDFASNSDFDCSGPLPVLRTGRLRPESVTAYTDTGASQVRFLMSIPEGGLADGLAIARASTTGNTQYWEITYRIVNGVSCLGIEALDDSGTVGVVGASRKSDVIAFSRLNGNPCRVSLDWTQSGSDIVYNLAVVEATPTAVAEFKSLTITGRTVGIVNRVQLNPEEGDVNVAIGHVTVENTITSLFADTDALVANVGEINTSSTGRLARLCAENGIPLQRYTGVPADAVPIDYMGPQLVAPLLDLLHECETSGQGQLWDGRSAGLQYTTHKRRELGTVKLTVNASAGQLAGEFTPIDDDQRNRNRVTVTRLHGASYTAEDSTGPLGTAAIGIYDDAVTVNCMADDSTVDFADWFVRLGTVPGYRYPSVTVDLAKSPTLAAQVLDVVPGERINVTNLNTTLAEFPDATVDLIVEGIAHEITSTSWHATFKCSPFAPWATGIEGHAPTGGTAALIDSGTIDSSIIG